MSFVKFRFINKEFCLGDKTHVDLNSDSFDTESTMLAYCKASILIDIYIYSQLILRKKNKTKLRCLTVTD